MRRGILWHSCSRSWLIISIRWKSCSIVCLFCLRLWSMTIMPPQTGLDWADGISTEQSHREQNRHYYLPFEKGRKGTLSSLTCFVISLHPSTLHNPLMPSPTSAVRRTSFTRVETVDFDGSWKAGDCRSPRWPTRPPYSRHAASNPVLGRQPDTFKSQVS